MNHGGRLVPGRGPLASIGQVAQATRWLGGLFRPHAGRRIGVFFGQSLSVFNVIDFWLRAFKGGRWKNYRTSIDQDQWVHRRRVSAGQQREHVHWACRPATPANAPPSASHASLFGVSNEILESCFWFRLCSTPPT